eukprot:s855_g13.t1
MFRRQLLGGLNAIWRHIEDLKVDPPVVRRKVPREVMGEVIRFCCLIPLAQLDFRLPMEPQVTASDASSLGGGLCASTGLTAYGVLAQDALLRGEVSEPLEQVEVLTIGLFDGIAALRVAAEILHLPVAGHISVECHAGANRVVEAAFPGTRHVGSVQEVTLEVVKSWACEYGTVGLVLLGAGPPCQGVSGLNSDRLGSQKDHRSCLYKEVPRIRQLVQRCFPWAQVHLFAESVASMDAKDRAAMSEGFGLTPCQVDAAGVSLCRRPRLYWMNWELLSEEGLAVGLPTGADWTTVVPVNLSAVVDQKDFLEAGWSLPPGKWLPTFTTSRPSARPGRRPAGVSTCDDAALARWHSDLHRYPPYQYKAENCLHHKTQQPRVASISEREVILGFPLNYTEHCMAKQHWKSTAWEDMRKTLLGNTWSVPVVVLLLKQLIERLGLVSPASVQDLVARCAPGRGCHLQTVLQRPPIRREAPGVFPDQGLARRLSTLVSVKGEDLMIQGATEPLVKHQRLRQTVPSRLWKWHEIAGWRLEGRSKQQRRQVRKQMGSLKSLTIQPCTRARYDKAKAKFYDYLRFNSLQLPTQKALLDGLLCDYLEYLWSTGEGRALASGTLAALQDTSPRIKGSIPGAWRLLRTWLTNEIPNRAPPVPERILHALTGYFLFHQQPRMALSLLLGFYSMLRTGELLGIRNKDVTVDVRNTTAVISLGFTKGGEPELTELQTSKEVARLRCANCSAPVAGRLGKRFVALPLGSFLQPGEASAAWKPKHHLHYDNAPEPAPGGAPNAGAAPGPGTALATPGSIQSPMAQPVQVEALLAGHAAAAGHAVTYTTTTTTTTAVTINGAAPGGFAPPSPVGPPIEYAPQVTTQQSPPSPTGPCNGAASPPNRSEKALPPPEPTDEDKKAMVAARQLNTGIPRAGPLPLQWSSTSARDVRVRGSWDGWKRDVALEPSPGIGYRIMLLLPAGEYEFKFIVDGTWTTSDEMEQTKCNNRNNVATVNEMVLVPVPLTKVDAQAAGKLEAIEAGALAIEA